MSPICMTCDPCGAAFDVDARRAGQSIPCPRCHARLNVPVVSGDQSIVAQLVSAPASAARLSANRGRDPATHPAQRAGRLLRLAIRLFMALPTPVHFALGAFACFLFGWFFGWVRNYDPQRSEGAFAMMANRVRETEQSLNNLNTVHAELVARQKGLEHSALQSRLDAETAKQDEERMRKLLYRIESEKGIPEWASEEKWQAANDEIARLKSENEKSQKLLASKNAKIESLRKLAEQQTARAVREYEKSRYAEGQRQNSPSDSEERAGAEIAAEGFVKRKLAHPSTAKFPFFGQNAKKNGDGTWTITGTVRAKNSFNLETTIKYSCQVKHDGDSWFLVDSLMTESDE